MVQGEITWGLLDRFVDDVIDVYDSRAAAERALANVLTDEPAWDGMFEVVAITVFDFCLN
jgi:hypothetical protein